MASFASSLRQLLGRRQHNTGSTPGIASINCFDGISDDDFHSQQISQRQCHVSERLKTSQDPQIALHPGAEVRVKQEPANHEDNDHDIFAEFTNEEFHDDSERRITVDVQQAFVREPESADRTARKTPLINEEPGIERPSFGDTADRADAFDSTATAGRSTIDTPGDMAAQIRAASTSKSPKVTLEDGASTFRVKPDPVCLTSNISSGPVGHAGTSQQQYSFEQQVQRPQQSGADSSDQGVKDQNVRSPSIDSVIGTQRHSSADDPLSLGSIDLAVNAHLLESQWRARHKLPGMSPLTAEVVQPKSILLHGPKPTQEQYAQQSPQPSPGNQPPAVHSAYYAQPTNSLHRSSDFPYGLSMRYPSYSLAAPQTQVPSHWVPSSMQRTSLPDSSPTNASRPQGFTNSDHVIQAQGNKNPKMSHDDQALATRAPRPATTGSTFPNQQVLTNSSSEADSNVAAMDSHTPTIKQNSVIELSDDEDQTAESFSWKLPDFEVTYHPAATDKDLPMAKVSIPGNPNNLVRSEVALTEDHAHQEMELFLNVFLPAQQALPTPDPEPAHAVLNFHTISVIVLETFVQYEIGDEMGRGYGFHGGNIENQALRPVSSASDEEPPRTRSAKDADVDEIFFAVLDRWRAGLISGKATLKLIRGCQEFCDIALDVIHYVKEHGLYEPEPKRKKERSDKGVKRGPRGGNEEPATKGKAAGKRGADAMEEGKASVKRGTKAGGLNTLQARKKTKVEDKKKAKQKAKQAGVTVIKKRLVSQ